MARYYFLICSLPRLRLEQPLEISFEELQVLLQLNLIEEDLEKIEQLRSVYDYLNLKAFWQKKMLDPKGILDEKKMEQALLVGDYFSEEVFTYMHSHPTVEEKLRDFTNIFSRFYEEKIKGSSGFLQKYFQLEKDVRLVMTALRSKKMHRDLAQELGEYEEKDFFLLDILAQRDADHYFPPDPYSGLKTLYEEYYAHPEQLQKNFLQYRIQLIKNIECEHFSIDEVLQYLAVYFIIYDWQQYNPSISKDIVEKLA